MTNQQTTTQTNPARPRVYDDLDNKGFIDGTDWHGGPKYPPWIWQRLQLLDRFGARNLGGMRMIELYCEAYNQRVRPFWLHPLFLKLMTWRHPVRLPIDEAQVKQAMDELSRAGMPILIVALQWRMQRQAKGLARMIP